MLLSLSFRFTIIFSLLLIYSQSLCSSNACKEKRGHFVKYVEKASFAHLNKLFEIGTTELAHNLPLSDKNLQALIENLKPFIIPVFSSLTHLSLVPNEHFMLKDLSFYEIDRLAGFEARHDHLEEREKKFQKKTFRQAPPASHLTSNSVVHPHT